MDPLVSVIVPTRDRHDFLDRALSSIGEQTYDAIETVVVDGSTTPVSDQRVRSSVGRPSTLRIKRGPRRGAAAARNVGITAAEGEYLAFLDDDDEWEPTKVERQVARLRSNPAVGVVYTGQRSVDAAGHTQRVRCPRLRGNVTEALLRGADITPLSAAMVRTSLVDRVGLLDEHLPVWEDLDWYVRLSRYTEFEPVADPLIVRRMGDHDQLSDQFETIRDVAFPRYVAKHRSLAAEFGPDCERAMVASRLLDVAHAGLEQGAYLAALPLLARSVRLSPRSHRAKLYLLAALGGPLTYRPARWLWRRVTRLPPLVS
jgi:glycosyltransferase involved in cell wall biosynthesis